MTVPERKAPLPERITEDVGRQLEPFFERFSGRWFVLILFLLLAGLFVLAATHL